MSGACDPRSYLRHQALAIQWLQKTRPGRPFPSDGHIVRTMRRYTAEQLQRMLLERLLEPRP